MDDYGEIHSKYLKLLSSYNYIIGKVHRFKYLICLLMLEPSTPSSTCSIMKCKWLLKSKLQPIPCSVIDASFCIGEKKNFTHSRKPFSGLIQSSPDLQSIHPNRSLKTLSGATWQGFAALSYATPLYHFSRMAKS